MGGGGELLGVSGMRGATKGVEKPGNSISLGIREPGKGGGREVGRQGIMEVRRWGSMEVGR